MCSVVLFVHYLHLARGFLADDFLLGLPQGKKQLNNCSVHTHSLQAPSSSLWKQQWLSQSEVSLSLPSVYMSNSCLCFRNAARASRAARFATFSPRHPCDKGNKQDSGWSDEQLLTADRLICEPDFLLAYTPVTDTLSFGLTASWFGFLAEMIQFSTTFMKLLILSLFGWNQNVWSPSFHHQGVALKLLHLHYLTHLIVLCTPLNVHCLIVFH